MILNELIQIYGDLWKSLLPGYLNALPSQTLGENQMKVPVGSPKSPR